MQRYLADAGGPGGEGWLLAVPAAQATLPHRSRGRDGQDASKSNHPDAAVACHCQSDLSAGGRAAASSRSALGRLRRIVELRRPSTDRGRYCRSDGRVSPAGPAPVPGAGGLLSPMWMPVLLPASTLNSFLPEHSVSTCRPADCRSCLWAASCAPARRVRAADCHHLPVWRLRGTQHAGDGPGWRQPEV